MPEFTTFTDFIEDVQALSRELEEPSTGDIKIEEWDGKSPFPPAEESIIEVLLSNGPTIGLNIFKLSNGKVKRGSVYVLLGRLEEKGFVEIANPSAPRPEYRLTPLGKARYKTWQTIKKLMGILISCEQV